MAKVKCICKQCGKEYFVSPSVIKQGTKYCSKTCSAQSQKKLLGRTCLICGVTFYVHPHIIKEGRGKYCSQNCYNNTKIGRRHSEETLKKMKESHAGNKNPMWGIRGVLSPTWKGGFEGMWKRDHVSPIRFKPISEEELNKILEGDDKE